MPVRALRISLILAVLLVAPAAAHAATRTPVPETGSPVLSVTSLKTQPAGFTSTAGQAVSAAERSPAMQSLHRAKHPLHYEVYFWRLGAAYWYVTFSYQGNVIAEVNVNPAGRVMAVWTGPQAVAPYGHGDYSPLFDHWWVMWPLAAAFLLVFFDPRRLWRLAHLDALVVLSFLASYLVLDHAHLVASVWLAYPPLVYLLGRMLWLGFRGSSGSSGSSRLAPLLSDRMLVVGLLVLVGARVAMALLNHQEIDVGYASVVGAHRINHGLPLYFSDPGHGDTYGPIAYLAYVPFERLFPWTGAWTGLRGADLAAITFDLVTIVSLVFLGRRLRPNREGTRLGLVLAWAWAACPFTALAIIVHTNDGLVAMLTVLALLAFRSGPARGALVGLAAAAKFSPAALLPLFANPRRGWREAAMCVAAFIAVVILAILLYLPSGGIREFYDHTLGYQFSRPDVFSPWGLHPTLKPIQAVLEGLALILVGAVAFFPRERSLARICALAGAVTIAVQLPAIHWFYYYIVWFMPFVLVATLALPAEAPAPALAGADEHPARDEVSPAPALVGA
ncbi:MAG TPA: glycosyltransferase 87 family protein [Solirubrobacteraceae bacterium]